MGKFDSFIKLNSYSDRSIVCIIPTRGAIDARVVSSWFRLITPINQRFTRIILSGGEVADSYNTAITSVLQHPQLSRYKYILTMEDDNIPPEDGLIKLCESMAAAEKKGEELWALSGLYWSKGNETGVPIAFGDRRRDEWNMDCIPLEPDGVTNCWIIPQGFTLYRTDLFRRLAYPWFKTVERYDPEALGLTTATQDVYFFKKCFDAKLPVGVRADVRVGHLDIETGFVW